MNIAIDGPAGAGKSSIAKEVAKRLSYVYIDTGAMYRTMALYFMRLNLSLESEKEVVDKINEISISIQYKDGQQYIFLNDEDVSLEIRKEEVGNNASVIAKYTAVRNKLVDLQRELASKSDVIMDGRDIGTVVLPNAEVKIYLTASTLIRAKRRHLELSNKGIECDINQIEEDIAARDYQDMNREISPLKQAEDGILLDSSDMTIEEVVLKIIAIVKENEL